MVGERCTVMDLLTARNGAPPPPVQTKSTRNEGRKRSFWRWQRRALKAARDHEGREAAEAVQAAERNQLRATPHAREIPNQPLDPNAQGHRKHSARLKQSQKGATVIAEACGEDDEPSSPEKR